ncbi:hypothetical protein ACIBHX_26255 [Nonomuraea sp. NPDC050536]|uniref:hypothetical protein n=1 Tax=Nonomuraea sp. NPDC050536 TaxID=3364366 RepID=UPI0037CB54FD
MIRRLFYISLGAALTLWVVRRLQALHPNHVARRTVQKASGVLAQVRDFTSDALGEAADREIELRTRFGLDNADHNN